MIQLAIALLAAARIVTLDDAVRSAREHQPQLRQARANTEAASARAREALAPLLPQLNATAGYNRRIASGGGTVATSTSTGAVSTTESAMPTRLGTRERPPTWVRRRFG